MVHFLDPEAANILWSLDPEIMKWTRKFLDPEIVEMVRFLDPEIVEKVDKSFMFVFALCNTLRHLHKTGNGIVAM